MKTTLRLGILVGLLAWLLGSGGCSPQSEIDKSILTGAPCAPPCWQGIIPGQTTQDESLAILSQSIYVKQGSVLKFYDATDDNTISWVCKADFHHNALTIHDNVVTFIDVTLDFRVTLGQLIDKYGPPDKIAVTPIGGAMVRVFLFYFQQGFEVRLSDFDLEPVEMSENSIIEQVFYHRPISTTEELYRTILESPENIVELVVRNSYDWTGYGPLKVTQP